VKVAIVHYWLVGMRGGEKVLEAFCEMFPDAHIYTHVYDPSVTSEVIRRHKIVTTSISKLPMAKRLYQLYLPFMPRALEEIDLTGYDLVISSESGPAKGVIVSPTAFHLCYCHSPMRYLWDQYHVYKASAPWIKRKFMRYFFHHLRGWDVTSSSRVDRFVANSSFVKKRIQKYYRRDSTVIYPPVDVESFKPCESEDIGEYYLWVGELVTYKRPDIMIEAFNSLGLPLVVIGGPEKQVGLLKSQSGPNIEFLGKVDQPTLRKYMAQCKALVFPGEEDFGIVPVEVMASGRPVIAYSKGGALDTVVDTETGVFFNEQTVKSLISAVKKFQESELVKHSPDKYIDHVKQFTKETFKRRMLEEIEMAKQKLQFH